MPEVAVGLAEDEGDDGLAAVLSKTVNIGLAVEGDSSGPARVTLGSQSCCSIGEPATPIF